MKEYQRIWSKKVLKVINTYNQNQKLFLFGITGDLDNLGIFVSQYGRPLAENLVDVYNRLIGAFMHNFIKRKSKQILAFCMIPSGEEIFALGVATTESVINNFFFSLKNKANNFIQRNACLANENVSISFGCKIIPNEIINAKALYLVAMVNEQKVKEASLAYLDLMLTIRNELAYELDKEKFKSLSIPNIDLIKLFRNIVYAKLQNYKRETKSTLEKVFTQLNLNTESCKYLQEIELNKFYGIADSKFMENLLKEIIAQ